MSRPDDPSLWSILDTARTIAVVGLSSKADRPSYEVASYLQHHGYRIIPINPNEHEVLSEPAYPSLRDVPADIAIDVVDVFRRPEATPAVDEEAVAVGAKVLWLQLGIVNDEAARIAGEAGLAVVMDVCMMTAHRRRSS